MRKGRGVGCERGEDGKRAVAAALVAQSAHAAGGWGTPFAHQPGWCWALSHSSTPSAAHLHLAPPPLPTRPQVLFVMRRVYQLEDLGVEVFFPGRASLYLTFKTTAHRERFIKLLMQQPNLQLEHMHRCGGRASGSGWWAREHWLCVSPCKLLYMCLHCSNEAHALPSPHPTRAAARSGRATG